MKDKLLIGQYYPISSFLHTLDARNKILIVFVYMVAIFTAKTSWAYAVVLVAFALSVAIAKVPLKILYNGMKPVLFLAIMSLVLHFFFDPGEYIWQWGFLHISKEGIATGFLMGIRLIVLVVFASLLTLSTKPLELTDGVESLLKPLTVIKVPAHEMAMMMSIALRFIPTLMEELERIMLAQRARGAVFNDGGLIKRAKNMIPLLVPLLISSFRRADDLAQAMDAKGYRGGKGRTRWHQLTWHGRDTFTLALFVLLLGVVLVLRFI